MIFRETMRTSHQKTLSLMSPKTTMKRLPPSTGARIADARKEMVRLVVKTLVCTWWRRLVNARCSTRSRGNVWQGGVRDNKMEP